MAPINIAVQGVHGRMGQQVLSMVCAEEGLRPVGGVNRTATEDSIALPDGTGTIPLSISLEDVISDADVVVDFSGADGALSAIRTAARRKVNVVIGSTGSPDSTLREAEVLADKHQVGIMIAPNFALGAVLMMHLAKQAGPILRVRRPDRKPSRGQGRRAVRDGRRDSEGRRRGQGQRLQRSASRKRGRTWYAGWCVRRCQHTQRPDARPSGPPRAGVRRSGPDPDDPSRLRQPRELHAWSRDGNPPRRRKPRPDCRPREDHGPLASHLERPPVELS